MVSQIKSKMQSERIKSKMIKSKIRFRAKRIKSKIRLRVRCKLKGELKGDPISLTAVGHPPPHHYLDEGQTHFWAPGSCCQF